MNKTQKEEVSPLEEARAKAAEAKREHAKAREALAIASRDVASLRPDDFETPAALTKKRDETNAKEARARDAEAFWAVHASKAEADLAPLEVEELHRKIEGGLVGRAHALDALRLACEQLGPQLDRVREAITVVRETQAGLERVRADLFAKSGESPRQNVNPDDTGHLVCYQLDSKLATPLSLLEACVALAKLEAERPGLEAQRQEMQRRIDHEKMMAHHRAAFRGDLGREEQKKAEEQQRAWDRKMHGIGPLAAIYKGTRGTSAFADVDIARRNLGLNHTPERD
jgi:hypothetical protein